MSENAVETRALSRTFVSREKRGEPKKTTKALNDVSLTVKRGELFGLLGPNGAGKTTMIKILCTLLLPTSGEAYVQGFDVKSQASSIRRQINMVSGGETSGYGLLTVEENLWMFSQFYGIPSKVAKDSIHELLGVMGLEGKENAKVRTLSTGMRQKMNMIRGFMTDPALIFLDEPTLGLDVGASRQIRGFVKKWIREEGGRTILLTTHYMMEAEELCDRIAIISDGEVKACDTPERLKSRLRKDSTLRLEVMGLGAPESLALSIKGMGSFTSATKPETGLTEMRFIVQDDSVVAEIVSELARRGGKIVGLHKTEPTLEDVFMAVTGRGLADGQGE